MLGIYTNQKQASQGFTLIEMSIVLVIIGLIIGGILKGQEIIESSRQKNVITQIDGIRSAINTFSDKYNAIPGDYRQAATRVSAAVVNGNGDGVIGVTTTASLTALNALTGAAAESVQFFDHLNAAELISGTTLSGGGGVTNTFGANSSFPQTAIPAVGMTAVYGDHDASSSRLTHWVRIHKDAGAAIDDGSAGSGAFTGKSLFQIDIKIDDGNGERGSARSAWTGGAATNDCSAGYNPLGNDQICTGYFELIQ